MHVGLERLLVRAIWLCMVVVSLFYASEAMAESACTGCHEEVATAARKQQVVHQPVGKGECEQCHLAGRSVAVAVQKSSLAEKKQQREKINWFWKSSARAKEHLLRLTSAELSGKVFLNAADGRRQGYLKELNIPNLDKLPRKEAEQQPPVLSEFQVTGVRRGISVTATLQWATDEYTDAEVYYGVDNLQSVQHITQLAKQHSCNLLGLAAEKTYQVKVVARDLFNNVIASPLLKFSTAESFWKQGASNMRQSVMTTDLDLNWEIFRLADDYLFVIKSDRPVSVSLGREGHVQDETLSKRTVDAGGGFSHPILKSAFDTNISVCKACHLDVQEEFSHPIKIKARPGMIIPDDFPLLPDKTISCMTCHIQHFSDNEYRLRKAKKSELCRSCHTNY